MQQGQLVRQMRANYGLDAPGLVWKFLFGGAGLFILGLGSIIWRPSILLVILRVFLLYNGLWMLLTGILMIRSSFVGKFRMRDRLLDDLHLRGDETVLDVGCGHGLFLIGAAHRLPRGHAVGVDLWSQVDQGKSNRKSTTLVNAEIEGVADRVEVYDGDMRQLPLDDASFDVVVASLAIHNIYSREERRKAIREIVRVLKPDGKVALLDFRHVKQYGTDLQALGMHDVHVSGLNFEMYPPVRIVTATKEQHR